MSIGIDIEEISRFSKLKYEKHKKFYKKIFTTKEINYCLKKADPYPHFAVRFCAKEAAFKAIGNKNIRFKDIETVLKNRKPALKILGMPNVEVSLSHSQNIAVAVVMYFD